MSILAARGLAILPPGTDPLGAAMTDALDIIREDHANLSRLLDALERELDTFDRGEEPDYDIIQGVAEYCIGYPDLYHHPIEDLLLRRLSERDPSAAKAVGDLEREHERLSAGTRRFQEAIVEVLQDHTVSRESFHALARDFVARYRDHMRREDEIFLSAVAKALGPEDRAAAVAEAGPRADPLFGEEEGARFEVLRERLLRWSREAG